MALSVTVIQVRLISVAGFAVNQNASSVNFTITDRDDCTNPDRDVDGESSNLCAERMSNGLVMRPGPRGSLGSGKCVCTTKSTVVLGGIAQGETESYATTALNWRTDSTNYCPESPYQRP